jgi:hypothetical protein
MDLIGDRGQLLIHCAAAYMAGLRIMGTFGPAGTIEDAQRWLTDGGLMVDVLERTGAIAHFDAHRPHDHVV